MNQPPPSVASVWARLRAHLGFKIALAVGLNLMALLPYYLLQHHVFFRVTVMKTSAIDHLVPFNDQTVWLYLSLFLLNPIAPMQMVSSHQLRQYALGVLSMSCTADLIFFLWPTAIERPETEAMNPVYHRLTMLVNPLNAFPSLHAAMAVYSALCCEQILSEARHPRLWRTGIWLWALGIIYATLATKEHVALDAGAGFILGLMTYVVAFGDWGGLRNNLALQSTSTG